MTPVERLVDDARRQGLLPANAAPPRIESRPWPVVMLTQLGAGLAAIPLMVVVIMLMGDWALRGAGTYVYGILLLAGATVLLRRPEVPVFLEQLAVPAFMAGGGLICFALTRDVSLQLAAATLTVLALALALSIDRPWLRVLLGMTAWSAFTWTLLAGDRGFRLFSHTSLWFATHATLAVWCAALWLQGHKLEEGARVWAARAVESVAAGWLLSLLLGLVGLAGMTFLASGVLGSDWASQAARDLGRPGMGHGMSMPVLVLMHGTSMLLTLAACIRMAKAWPGLRSWACSLLALVLSALALWLPELGAACLVLAWTLTTGRRKLAAAAGLTAVWVLGSFYYALEWPLTVKAMVLLVAGATLGALAWGVLRGNTRPPAAGDTSSRLGQVLIGLALLGTLATVNWAIQDKEELIARGDRILLELAPVDPRSLMQGDYMRLAFNLPDMPPDVERTLLRGQRPLAVGRPDAQGVLRLTRLRLPGQGLEPGEVQVQLTPKGGQWVVVTDAWFFREGDAARWETARYGDFRVTPDGRALLVGLADAQRQPIRP